MSYRPDRVGPSAEPHTRLGLRICVGAVVVEQDRILFVRQSPGHPLEGQWTVPWGFVDPGESPVAAAVRETREEGGVEVYVRGLLGVQELEPSGRFALAFLCSHVDGTPRPDGHETDRAAYLSAEEIQSLEDPLEPWSEWIALRVLAGHHRLIPENPEIPLAPGPAYL